MHRSVETAFTTSGRPLIGLALLIVVSAISCGPREEPTLTRGQIFEERIKVDTLYLTEDGREIIAPGTPLEAIVYPKTNKLAWRAWQCNNPDCPGEGKDGRPFLFTCPDPFKFVAEDGTVGIRQPEDTDKDRELFARYSEQVCPACLPLRNRETETLDQRLQYQQWCQPYVLPRSAKQLKKLDDEFRRREDEMERRRRRKASG